jgi:nucleotide-binding universal stress UspA family protein
MTSAHGHDAWMDDYLIMTGWDGSPESDEAVRAAGRLAVRTHGRVRVVLAWDFLTQPARFDPHFDADDAARHVRLAARRLLPADVRFETRAVLGRPHEVLIEQAQQADLLVIGRSGLGRAFARLMGSTVTEVVRGVTIPVVVVPSGNESEPGFTGQLDDIEGVKADDDDE